MPSIHAPAHTSHAGRVQGFRRFNFAVPQRRCENPPPPRHVARGVSPSGRHSAELRRQKTIKASRGTHDGCGKEEENGRTTMDDMHGAPAGRCRQPPRQESQQPSLQVQPAKTTRETNIRAAAQQATAPLLCIACLIGKRLQIPLANGSLRADDQPA